MQTPKVIGLRWWHFNQNNSGGYFIDNDIVSHDVFIQANNANEARDKAEVIFEPFSEYCQCCGERWYVYCREDEGTELPSAYGEPVNQISAGLFRKTYVLHHFDGRVEKHRYL